MKVSRKVSRRVVSLFLIFSIIYSFFVFPITPTYAGILGSFLQAIRPLAIIGGKIAGAVIGASLCAGFVPPLGMIAGGIVGWIAGGIISSYGTASLLNLATLAGGAIGAMALGPGALGMVGGFLIGAFLGRTAMNLLQGADRELTGGILLNKAQSTVSKVKNLISGNNAGLTSSQGSSAFTPVTPSLPGGGIVVSSDRSTQQIPQIKEAEARYKTAYQEYVIATQKGDTATAKKAHQEYLTAYQEYQNLLSQGK